MGGQAVYFAVFGWSREVIVKKFSVLLGCSFPGHLAGENRLSCGCFLSVPIGLFPMAGFYHIQSELDEGKRKPREFSIMLFHRI